MTAGKRRRGGPASAIAPEREARAVGPFTGEDPLDALIRHEAADGKAADAAQGGPASPGATHEREHSPDGEPEFPTVGDVGERRHEPVEDGAVGGGDGVKD